MEKTPNSLRTHVTIFGNTNTGKSTLFNALLGQDLSIVSNTSGTTTDTVKKAAELLPYGPIVLMDSAGFNDVSSLGAIREKKARKLLSRTDFADIQQMWVRLINPITKRRFWSLKILIFRIYWFLQKPIWEWEI